MGRNEKLTNEGERTLFIPYLMRTLHLPSPRNCYYYGNPEAVKINTLIVVCFDIPVTTDLEELRSSSRVVR